jgi:hypothetical protein
MFGASKAMEQTIKMQPAKVLYRRLEAMALTHFAEKTEIDKQLGGEDILPAKVILKIEQAISEYTDTEYMRSSPIAELMQIRKPLIIKEFIKDHPETIKNLQNQGVL